MMHARNELAAHHYGAALRDDQRAPRCAPGPASRRHGSIGTIAACGTGNLGAARTLLPKERGSYRDVALHRCEVLHVDLE